MRESTPQISIPSEGSSGNGKDWLLRLQSSLQQRAHEEGVWNRNLKWENNKHWDEEEEDTAFREQDRVSVNKVGVWLADRIPKVMFKQPGFQLSPRTRAGYRNVPTSALNIEGGSDQDIQVPAYKMAQAAMNYYATQPELDFRGNIRRAIHGGYSGFGCIKTGYGPHLARDFDNTLGKKKPEDNYLRDDLNKVILDDAGDPILIASKLQDAWFMDFMPWWRMLMDPDGGVDIRNHSFIACEYLMTIESLQANPRYKNTGDLGSGASLPLFVNRNDDLEPNTESVLYGPVQGNDEGDEQKFVRVFELFDHKKNRLITVADGYEQELENIPTPQGIDRNPYSTLRFHERPWQFYQRTEVDDIVRLNQEWDIFRTQLLRWVRRTNRKYMARRGAFKPAELKKLTSNEDMAVALVDREIDEGLIKELPMAGISGDFFGYGNMILRDLDEVGRTSAATSRNAGASQTATAIGAAEQHHSVGIEDDRETVALFIADIGTKLLRSMKANMTGEMMIEITGEQGAEYALDITREQLYSECHVKINANEMAPRNSDLAMQQFTELFKTIIQMPQVLQSEKFVSVMADLYGIHDPQFVEAIKEVGEIMMQSMMAAPPGGGPVAGNEGDLRSIQGGKAAQ
jgi:hypothetical protein